ncbi:MAG: 23S rRNA (pseudouridine(1915)-N(3))-methyltransferase RlmH [Gammaproteobacteria bacterium]|nr:23S rRNA (pseudouridine(1915)-N(3))-methyltransferase RlmH [Gammaproteobacteria bacterium]
MAMRLVAVGTRVPAWVTAGYDEYARRLNGPYRLQLTEIPAGHRGKGADLSRLLREEGDRILGVIPAEAFVVTLDVRGRMRSSEALVQDLESWLRAGRLTFIIGGAEGLSQSCQERANDSWSLSPLTLPHALVRVVVAEQLYRAFATLTDKPYHRAQE